MEENEELENLLKWGKFSFYVMVDRENFHISEKQEIADFSS